MAQEAKGKFLYIGICFIYSAQDYNSIHFKPYINRIQKKKTDDNDNVSINIYNRDRYRYRPTCPIMDCPYVDADSIPNNAIVLDMFDEKEKLHIEQYHPEC